MKRNTPPCFYAKVRTLYAKAQCLCCLVLCLISLPVFLDAQESTNQEMNNVTEESDIVSESTEADTAQQEFGELTRIKQTLQFGTDTAVLESLTTLSNMGLDTFAPDVLTRMRSSTHETVLTQGFTYLRDVAYSEALDFATSYVGEFQDNPSRAVQFAFFYIQDFATTLSEEAKQSLNDVLLRILEEDNPSLSLTALALLPRYYSEKDEPYYGDTFFEDEPVVNIDMPIRNVPRDITNVESRLLSEKLIVMYETINTQAVQDEIISTLGKIHAYNALPFLLDLADNKTRISQSRRSAIILALGSFELVDDIFSTMRSRRLTVFQNARRDPSPKIRKALFEAIHINKGVSNPVMEHKIPVPQWLIEGIRDDAIPVRQAVLTRMEALFEHFTTEEQTLFFEAVSFLVRYDASNIVRAQAVKVLSKFPQGKALILAAVKDMTTLNPVNSAYLAVALDTYAQEGGLQTLGTMVEKTIDESKQRRSFFSDALALMQEVSSILATKKRDGVRDIVSIMLQHPDTTIQKNMLTVIAKNNLVAFLSIVQDISQDVAVPSSIRVQAQQTAEVLQSQ